MSYKTYANYNSDNVIKTVENVREWATKDRNGETDPVKKKLKDALLVFVTESLGDGARTTRIKYEKLLTGRWFNWVSMVSFTEDEFVNMIKSLNEEDWEVFSV